MDRPSFWICWGIVALVMTFIIDAIIDNFEVAFIISVVIIVAIWVIWLLVDKAKENRTGSDAQYTEKLQRTVQTDKKAEEIGSAASKGDDGFDGENEDFDKDDPKPDDHDGEEEVGKIDVTNFKREEKTMERYMNSNGNSNILAYETGDDYIDVMFGDHSVYRYSYASCGEQKVETMKQLAWQGHGLNSFIMRNCRYGYEFKR